MGGSGGAERRKQAAQRRQALAAQLRPHKKAQSEAEALMDRLQSEKDALEEKLSAGLPQSELADAGRRLKQLDEELSNAEEAWLAAGQAIEALELQADPAT